MNSRFFFQVNAFVFASGMILFALSAHKENLIIFRFCGIGLSIFSLSYTIAKSSDLFQLFGFTSFPGKYLWFLPICAGIGFILAIYYRDTQGKSYLIHLFTSFSFIAIAIGITEELAYRGFIQGCFKKYGKWTASIIASILHTLYKVSLFIFPETPGQFDLFTLGYITLFVGILIGLMREYLGSLIFPILAHASFDLFAYGDLESVPWWIQ